MVNLQWSNFGRLGIYLISNSEAILKLFLLLLLLTVTSVNAYECNKFETQIIGVGEIVSSNELGCLAKLNDIIDYRPSILCPVLLEEITRNFIALDEQQCIDVSENGNLSGVIVQDENHDYLFLDN